MRKFLYLLVIAGSVVSAAEAADSPAGSTEDMLENCASGLTSGKPTFMFGICIGFVDAVLKHIGERAAAGDKLGICMSSDLTEMGVIQLFVAWATIHRGSLSAFEGIQDALRERFPCSP